MPVESRLPGSRCLFVLCVCLWISIEKQKRGQEAPSLFSVCRFKFDDNKLTRVFIFFYVFFYVFVYFVVSVISVW